MGLFDDWAHNIQIMKMCEAFANNGLEVELVVPKRKNTNNNVNPKITDPYYYNNVENNFRITQLPFLDFSYGNPSSFFYWLRFLSFLVTSRIYLALTNYDILYTREHYFAPFFRNVFVEKHALPTDLDDVHKFLYTKAKGIIVITNFLKSRLMDHGIDPEKILVSHDGVNLNDFKDIMSQTESRQKLKIDLDKFYFGYLGTLKTMGMEKGVKTGIDSLAFLPKNFVFYVIGGDPIDVGFYKNYAESVGKADRVIFTGRIPVRDRELYVGACDIMVAPFPVHEHYSYYMSPLKIFEYMASKRPIIVTDLPSLREVLKDKETGLFVPPENPKALADAIIELSMNKNLYDNLVVNAYKEVSENYTWIKRSKTIYNFALENGEYGAEHDITSKQKQN